MKKSNVKLPVKFDGQYDKIRSYTDGNPYSIWFIYQQKGNPYIIKGGARDLVKWVENEFSDKNKLAIVNKTYWHHGKHRSYWDGINIGYYVSKLKNGKWELYAYPEKQMFGGVVYLEKQLRKPPHRWIKDIDKYFERNIG